MTPWLFQSLQIKNQYVAAGTFIHQTSKATVKKKDLHYPFLTLRGWNNPVNVQTVISVTY